MSNPQTIDPLRYQQHGAVVLLTLNRPETRNALSGKAMFAAVNGPAIGAGNDLACMCDIRIAASTARFAESFVKLGSVPGDGGCWLLPRVVGTSNAAEMALTGDAIDAAEALDQAGVFQGLAHHTADHAEAVSAFFDKRPPVFKG